MDMQFGDFLRALITADSDLVPDDPHGYRAALIKACRLRGIIPERVRSYSEEALRWCGPDEIGRPLPPPCEALDYRIIRWRDAQSRADAEAQIERHNAKALHDYATANAEVLGLDPDPARKIEAHSFHPIHRISPDGQLVINFVAEFLQQRTAPVAPSVPNSPTFTYRGGSTVIFGEEHEVRYVIEKSITNRSRLLKQQGFHLRQLEAPAGAAYVAPQQVPSQVNFQLVHRGV